MLIFDPFQVLLFDCYGTLIDWETGILSAIKSILFENEHYPNDDEILTLYAQHESEAERGDYIKYRDVLKRVAIVLADKYQIDLPEDKKYFLADSIKNWLPFSDTVDALKSLKTKYKLGILSNVDNDLFEYSAEHLEVNFDFVFTAEEIGSYKPNVNNFHYAVEHIDVPTKNILHVAQSLYHDVAVAKSVGLSTVWVNRRHDKPGFGATPLETAFPDMEVPDLSTLAELSGAR